MSVLMLERQPKYRDHVRGEILWPWGVRVAQQLGIEQVLLDAGGRVVRWFDFYDEGASSPTRDDVGTATKGVGGSLNVTHPAACAALSDAAVSAGADIRQGVREVHVVTGGQPLVRWLDKDGTKEEARCDLIVGADGRRSSVRSQVRSAFEVDKPAHLIAGMLTEGIDGLDESVNVMARESDLLFFSFPQGDGQARLYFCFPTHQRSRFAGATARNGSSATASWAAWKAWLDGTVHAPLGLARRSRPKTVEHHTRSPRESS